MRTLVIATIAYLVLLPAIAWVLVWQQRADDALLNVSYDPTRELWRDLNKAFRAEYERDTGKRVAISMSHGSSGGQARSVIDGLDADVVSLAMWSDTDAIRKAGLIAPGWDKRPHAQPYHSTLVFVVRAGNPKNIVQWDDLIRGDVSIVTPNPKTSGNGRLSLLAAWGAVLKKEGGTPEEAERFVTEMYRRTPVLDTGARGSAMTFAKKGMGDVHLTWESDAHLEVAESNHKLQVIYPKWSIRAEPPVAVVDANVDRRGTREVAQKYLEFMFTEPGQRIIVEHYYRPLEKYDALRDRGVMQDIELFDISLIWKDWKKKDWDEVQKVFFADNGVFDRIYQKK